VLSSLIPASFGLTIMTDLSHEFRLESELALYRLLTRTDRPTKPLSICVRANGLEACLRIGPPGADLAIKQPGGLDARSRKVIEAVRVEAERLDRRVFGREVLAALKLIGYRIGRSTLNNVLADLRSKGYLVNDGDKQGYGLPEPAGPDRNGSPIR